MAWTEVQRRHVRIDMVTSRFPRGIQTWLAGIMNFMGAVYVAFTTWGLVVYVQSGLSSPATFTPNLSILEAPFPLMLAIGCLLLCLAMLVNCFHPLPARGEKKEENK